MNKNCNKNNKSLIKLDCDGYVVNFNMDNVEMRWSCIWNLLKSNTYPSIQDIVNLQIEKYGEQKNFNKSIVLTDIKILKDYLEVQIEYSRKHKGYCLNDLQWDTSLQELINMLHERIKSDEETHLAFEKFEEKLNEHILDLIDTKRLNAMDAKIKELEKEISELKNK